MTQISDKPIVRETYTQHRCRALVAGLSMFSVIIRQKGRRQSGAYEVPYEAIYSLGAKLAARAAAAEKAAKKKGARR